MVFVCDKNNLKKKLICFFVLEDWDEFFFFCLKYSLKVFLKYIDVFKNFLILCYVYLVLEKNIVIFMKLEWVFFMVFVVVNRLYVIWWSFVRFLLSFWLFLRLFIMLML